MAMHVALLRGINVAGRNMVAMSALRELFESLGFDHVKSLLQSGNLVFRSDRRTGDALERLLELETAKRFNLSADYVVRTANEFGKIVARNPFPQQSKLDPSHVLVLFLKQPAVAEKLIELQAAIQGPEIFLADGRQLYIVYPAGIGRSKLTSTLIERKLGCRGTARNWNTVLKLATLLNISVG